MTFEEETRQMFAVLTDKLNRIEASVAHNKAVNDPLADAIDVAVYLLETATEDAHPGNGSVQSLKRSLLARLSDRFLNGK
jgi:hypothetical protein